LVSKKNHVPTAPSAIHGERLIILNTPTSFVGLPKLTRVLPRGIASYSPKAGMTAEKRLGMVVLHEVESTSVVVIAHGMFVRDRFEDSLRDLAALDDVRARRVSVDDHSSIGRDVDLDRHGARVVVAEEEMAQLADGNPEVVDLFDVEARSAPRIGARQAHES
jgi:hypothetical protein